jgi:hypothetical protein
MSQTQTYGIQIATALTTNIPVFRQVELTRYPTTNTSAGAIPTSRTDLAASGTNAPAGSLTRVGSSELIGIRGQIGQASGQPARSHTPIVPLAENQPVGGRPPQGPSGRGGGGSGDGGGRGGGGLGMVAAAAVAVPILALPPQVGVLSGSNGAMRGHAPEIFNGQCKNAAKFMYEFRLWKICNVCNEAMINLF